MFIRCHFKTLGVANSDLYQMMIHSPVHAIQYIWSLVIGCKPDNWQALLKVFSKLWNKNEQHENWMHMYIFIKRIYIYQKDNSKTLEFRDVPYLLFISFKALFGIVCLFLTMSTQTKNLVSDLNYYPLFGAHPVSSVPIKLVCLQ